MNEKAVEEFTAAVKESAARDGISEDEAANNLLKLLNTEPVEDAITTDIGERVEALEAKVAALESK